MPVSTFRPVSASFAMFATVFLASGALAQVVTVGPAGSGAMYEEIHEGIAAAPPGGVVLVAAGQYGAYVPITIDKPLTLLGAGSATTTFESFAVFTLPLPLLVTGLAAGEQVFVGGMTLKSFPFGGGGPFGLASIVVADCQGPVVLADLRAAGYISPGAVLASVQVRDSAMVTFDRCAFATGSVNGEQPRPSLHVLRSLVHVNACELRGAAAVAPFLGTTSYDGAPAVQAVDATVRIARSVILGGHGNQPNPFQPATVATDGGAAVHATNSRILVRGGPGSLLRGGTGGTATSNGVPSYGAGGSALWLDATSLASGTPDVAIEAGADGDLQVTAAPVAGPGPFAPLAHPLAGMASATALVAPGTVAGYGLDGEPAAICLPLCALGQHEGVALPGVLGHFTLATTSLVALPALLLDAAGAAVTSLAVPSNASLVGAVVHAQAVTFGQSGWVSVSGPTSFAVR